MAKVAKNHETLPIDFHDWTQEWKWHDVYASHHKP